MVPKNFKSILQDDCDRIAKKFGKIAAELGILNKGITDEYLQSLPIKERNMIMEKAIKLHFQFIPLISLQDMTSNYLAHILKVLEGLNKKQEPKEVDK